MYTWHIIDLYEQDLKKFLNNEKVVTFSVVDKKEVRKKLLLKIAYKFRDY